MASRSGGDRPPCDARELRQQGRAILDSAVEAARSRFRPIVMTSFAFIFGVAPLVVASRSEEHTSELQSLRHLVCRLLLEKKKRKNSVTSARLKQRNGGVTDSTPETAITDDA